MLHTFEADLAYERQPQHYHLLYAACVVVWAAALSGLVYEHRLSAQKDGIDWTLALHDGRQITLDTKTRRRDYTDVALEYAHDHGDQTCRPGWVEKPLRCDLIVYLFPSTRRAVMIPWRPLQTWWIAERDQLLEQYPTVRARNPGYESLSCCIPTEVILTAIPSTRVIQL